MSDGLTRVATVITLLRRLGAVLDDEVRMLRRMQLAGLPAVVALKEELAAAYERELTALRREPEVLGALAIDQRRALEEAIRGFQAKLAASRQHNAAARQVLEDIVRLVARSAARHELGGAGYGPVLAAPPLRTGAPPVALNRRV